MQRRTVLAASLGLGLATTLGSRAQSRAHAAGPALVVDNLDQQVTANEIASFKQAILSQSPSDSNVDNEMLFLWTGDVALALNTMVDITDDLEILNEAVRYSSVILSGRNDPVSGRLMYTGLREPIWPSKAASEQDSGYIGADSGFQAGLLAGTARLILQRPTLWGTTVPDGDPFGLGSTYRQRADSFLVAADLAIDCVLRLYLRSGTNRLYNPDNAAFGALGTPYENIRGLPCPWNTQSMLALGLVESASCHDTLADDPGRVTWYETVLSASMNWFRASLSPQSTGGVNYYYWNRLYGATAIEDVSHAEFDMFGPWLGVTRGLPGLSVTHLRYFTNTYLTRVSLGVDPVTGLHGFSYRIDGTAHSPAIPNPFRTYMRNYSARLCSVNKDWYPIIANAYLACEATEDDFDLFPGLKIAVWTGIMLAKHERHLGNWPS